MGIDEQGEGDGRHQYLIDDELLPVKHVILLKVHVGENAAIVRRTSVVRHGEVAAQTHPTVLVLYEHFILLGRWHARHSEHASRKCGRHQWAQGLTRTPARCTPAHGTGE